MYIKENIMLSAVLKPMLVVVAVGVLYAVSTLLYAYFNNKK